MNASYEEIGQVYATFAAQEVEAGQVCKVSGNGQVSGCSAGEKFCGVVGSVRGGWAGVQIKGFARVSFTGTAPATGYVQLAADGNGGVKTATGREYLVVSVDETAKTAVIEL